MKLSGKTAVVTGGGRGIGRAIARAFAAEGARVVLTARTAAEIDTVAEEIRAAGGSAVPVVADGRLDADVQRTTAIALAETGAIDVLVNNAGVYGPIGPFADTDLAAWRDAIDANLGGVVRFCHSVIPHMAARRFGVIINLSGGGATSPLPNFSAYSVSKTAIVRLSETLAEELAPHNIRVNAIAPGAVDTRLQDQLLAAGERAGADLFERIKRIRETGAGGVPATVAAELAVFLASSDSERLTGKLISAPHDPWREWAGRGADISGTAMYTLRRLDPFTIRPVMSLL